MWPLYVLLMSLSSIEIFVALFVDLKRNIVSSAIQCLLVDTYIYNIYIYHLC